jgi:hypothetical protein
VSADAPRGVGKTQPISVLSFQPRLKGAFSMFDFGWPYFVVMGLLAAGLVGVLIYMRTRPKD